MGKTNNKKVSYKNYNKYHKPGGANYQTVPKNAICISNANSAKHEIAKAVGAYMLHKFGDILFNDKIHAALEVIDEEVRNCEMVEQSTDFITEAVPNNEGGRRVDLVDLKSNTRFEFETDHKIEKDNAITIYI